MADYLVGKGWIKFGMSDPLHESMLKLNPIVDECPYIEEDDRYDDFPLTYQQATEQYGYTEAKARFIEYRRLLQVFGTEVGRDLFGVNVWSDIMKRRAGAAVEGGHDVIVTGIRFPNEIAAIKELGGSLWWVDRGDVHIKDQHASENSVGPEDFDVLLANTSTLDHLYQLVDYSLKG